MRPAEANQGRAVERRSDLHRLIPPPARVKLPASAHNPQSIVAPNVIEQIERQILQMLSKEELTVEDTEKIKNLTDSLRYLRSRNADQ